MYGETSQPGWTTCAEYTSENIEKEIQDTTKSGNQEKIKNPRTSVPSPFARFELVQKAFDNVAAKKDKADQRDLILVSHSLDLLQLFYEQGENIEDGNNGFQVVRWSKNNQLQELRESEFRGHNMLGSAYELYMRQENYGFNERLYYTENGYSANDVVISIILYNGIPLGCTSPTSIFMPTPDYKEDDCRLQREIKIGGSNSLFGIGRNLKKLSERDTDFILYVYRFMESIRRKLYKDTDHFPLSSFKSYLDQQKREIRSEKGELYGKISEVETGGFDDMNEYYQQSSSFSVLGYELYSRIKENAIAQIEQESDFVIKSTKSEALPLVLTNKCTFSNWAYTSRNNVWSLAHARIKYNRRKTKMLPGDGNVEYKHGWLCENDFLSDVLIKLPYSLDDVNFWSHYNDGCSGNYLLPIKDEFFKYFDCSYLKGRSNGKYNFRLKEKMDGSGKVTCVIANLDIPVKNGKILTLEKIYNVNEHKDDEDNVVSKDLSTISAEEDYAVGYVVECPIALNIMPFVRFESDNFYHIQLMRGGYGWDDYKIELHLMQTKLEDSVSDVELEMDKEVIRSKNTSYYKLAKADAFDYIKVNVTDVFHNHPAVLVPLWEEKTNGTIKYEFSFDFGTSNSHVSVKKDGDIDCMDFCVRKSVASTMKNSEQQSTAVDIIAFQEYVKQEFLPYKIGSDYAYSFPLRTVVLSPNSIDFNTNMPMALSHVNIPFAYGKEDYGMDRNTPNCNIKWGAKDRPNAEKFAKAFVEEMVILARMFALENNGNLQECSFVWTYPLSMKKEAIDRLSEEWEENYKTYFGDKEGMVTAIPESIAPMLFYRKNGRAKEQMTLSIDIGGGTSDVLIFESKDSIKITSFRFAADVIFGAVPSAKNNPMVKQFYKEFSGMLKTKKDTVKLIETLTNFCGENTKAESSEANSMLFSLENNPILNKVSIEDKSYNLKLSRDSNRKIIFVYFYAVIICYLTKLMISQNLPKPERLLFSGTGSKLLNIIGGKAILAEFSTKMFEVFSDGKYSYGNDNIKVEIENKKPKQLTAEGALFANDAKCKDITETVKPKEHKVGYSMIKDKPVLTYGQVAEDSASIYDEVVLACKDFHKQFIKFVEDMELVDEYGYSEDSVEYIRRNMDKELLANLKTEIANIGLFKDIAKGSTKAKEMEDTLFFYALKGVIADFISNVKK